VQGDRIVHVLIVLACTSLRVESRNFARRAVSPVLLLGAGIKGRARWPLHILVRVLAGRTYSRVSLLILQMIRVIGSCLSTIRSVLLLVLVFHAAVVIADGARALRTASMGWWMDWHVLLGHVSLLLHVVRLPHLRLR